MEEGTKAAVSETVLEQQGEKQGEGGLLDKIRSLLGTHITDLNGLGCKAGHRIHQAGACK